MNTPVVVIDYDSQWPIVYEKEKNEILRVAGHKVLAIEHIGSTAVPGLGAKPIIDIMVAVRHLSDADQCIQPLQSIGYEYVPEPETQIPEWRYFRKGPQKAHRHLHMVELTGSFWRRQLLFRDYLRSHSKVAREYYELKKQLASECGLDRKAYTDAKTSFVQSVIDRAQTHSTPKSQGTSSHPALSNPDWHEC
jgi:GrpB-like predicted nucleotidyltransferase (UPF0157 family)